MSDEKPEIQLFIKSSTIDREQKGSCPLCQQWFMAACILTEQGILSFHVTIVDAESPPKEFKDLSQSKIFPVVKGIRGLNKRGQDIGDKLADDHEGLEEFFESFGCPDLKRDGAVQKHFDDLYKHFNAFLQNGTDQARNRLVAHLEKLNTFLEGEDQIYLTKDVVTYGDCYLMPRLHHIKVACREFADFEIPEKLFYVWRYLYETYKTDAFQKTSPSDQDIIKHYEKKAKVFKPKKGVPSLQKSSYSFDVAESVLNTLENEPQRQDVNTDNPQLYETAHDGQDEADIYEAPDNGFEQESPNNGYQDGAPDNGYDQETRNEVDHEPEHATYDESQEAEPVTYEAPDEADPAIYEALDQQEPATYDDADEAESAVYEAPPVENLNTYETAQNDQNNEANTYDAAEINLANASPARSVSPAPDGSPEVDRPASPTRSLSPAPDGSPEAERPSSPTRSVSPTSDGRAEVDNLEQTYDDPIEYDAYKLSSNNTFKNTTPSTDENESEDQTQAGQEESPYENVEARGVPEPSSKSVDFSIPPGNPGVEVNGTAAGHD